MDDDWDLQAVVRGYCSAVSSSSSSSATTTCSTATTTTTSTAQTWPVEAFSNQKSTFRGDNFMGFFPDLSQPRRDNSIEQLLHDLYNPLEFANLQKPPPSPQSLPISPLSVLGGLQDLAQQQQQQHQQPPPQQQQKQFQTKQQPFGISRCTTGHAQSTTRSKKRKNQMKRVCQVPAEGLSSDMWSWRKYGQKPIKGSPYPRGYYRCSTSKGCLARKQVERNRSDPGMFIVTYTGEHSHPMPTHRNSLAGSTRNKPTTSGDDETNKSKPTSSSPVSPGASLSPATEKTEEERGDDTDDDNFAASDDVVMDDDFFEGLDELVCPVVGDGDRFSDAYPAEMSSTPSHPSFPWLSNSVATTTTTAAGGS